MKISELIQNLQDIQATHSDDLEVVTGEEWFPEQLLTSTVNHNLAFLQFDRMPNDIPAEIDARGFLEHEERLINTLITNVIFSELEPEAMVEKITSMLVFSHEHISSDVIEHFSKTDK